MWQPAPAVRVPCGQLSPKSNISPCEKLPLCGLVAGQVLRRSRSCSFHRAETKAFVFFFVSCAYSAVLHWASSSIGLSWEEFPLYFLDGHLFRSVSVQRNGSASTKLSQLSTEKWPEVHFCKIILLLRKGTLQNNCTPSSQPHSHSVLPCCEPSWGRTEVSVLRVF